MNLSIEITLVMLEIAQVSSIEEQRAMWQAILAAKDDLSAKVPKPSRKKEEDSAKA